MDSDVSPEVNADTLIQFDIIAQLGVLLRPAGINFWLRGGWAIDFLLGQLTRSHSDIDIVAWKRDATQLSRLFEKAGYSFNRDTGVQVDYSKFDQDVSVVLIAQDDDDVYVENVPDWVWLPGALSLPPQELDGLFCKVLSPQQLLEEKKGYQSGTGRPPRPKDLQSIEVLRQIISQQK